MVYDETLLAKVRTELFGNLAHYRQHCINETEDAKQVIRFMRKYAEIANG